MRRILIGAVIILIILMNKPLGLCIDADSINKAFLFGIALIAGISVSDFAKYIPYCPTTIDKKEDQL